MIQSLISVLSCLCLWVSRTSLSCCNSLLGHLKTLVSLAPLIGFHVIYTFPFNIVQELIAGFDQEAAAVTMARLVSFKMENEVSTRGVGSGDTIVGSFCCFWLSLSYFYVDSWLFIVKFIR